MKKLLIFVAIPAFACAASNAACYAVDSDRILGRDFALANAEFSSLDPKLAVAPSPMPGVTRTFHPEEIARLARLNRIELTPPVTEFCFERTTESLTIEKLMPALRSALGIDDAQIEIVDFSRSGVPRGALLFSRTGLSAPGLSSTAPSSTGPSSTAMWRGKVTYDDTRTASIWVKVKITAERTWIEALEPIASGKLIESSQVVIKTGPRFPFGPVPLNSIDLVASRKTLRSIRAGEPIFASMLTAPHDIERGDTVRVAVTSGGALLEFDGVAQAPARIGDAVLVKNLETSHLFQARVQEKGKVSVTK